MGAHIVRCYADKSPLRSPSWQSHRASVAELQAWQDVRGGADFGLNPSSLGLYALDFDSGDIEPLLAALDAAGADYLRLPTRRGAHLYLRAPALLSLGDRNWRYGSAEGQVRWRGYCYLHGNAADRIMDWLLLDEPAVFDVRAVLGENLILGGAAVNSSDKPKGSAGDYDSVAMRHGRAVFNATVKGLGLPSWAGWIAEMQGMSRKAIKASEKRGSADGKARLAWASEQVKAWREALPALRRKDDRLYDTLRAMLALAGEGRECWANQSTIGEIAGGLSRAAVQKHQARLEALGVIERLPFDERAVPKLGGSVKLIWKIKSGTDSGAIKSSRGVGFGGETTENRPDHQQDRRRPARKSKADSLAAGFAAPALAECEAAPAAKRSAVRNRRGKVDGRCRHRHIELRQRCRISPALALAEGFVQRVALRRRHQWSLVSPSVALPLPRQRSRNAKPRQRLSVPQSAIGAAKAFCLGWWLSAGMGSPVRFSKKATGVGGGVLRSQPKNRIAYTGA